MHYIVLVFFGASNVSHVLYKFVSSFCLSHSSKMEHRRGAPPRRNFQCRVCQQVFNTFILARDHFLADHLYQTLAQARQNLRCGICAEHYVRISHHLSSRHIKLNIPCNRCNNVILHSDKVYDNHIKDIHPAPEGSIFNVIETAYSGRVQTFLATFLENRHLNLESSFIALANPLIALVKYQLQIQIVLRFAVILKVRFVKYDEMGGIESDVDIPLRSTSRPVYLADRTGIHKIVNDNFSEIVVRCDQFLTAGSGWSLDQVLDVRVEIGRLHISGGCCEKLIKMKIKPHKIKYLTDASTLKSECFFSSVSVAMLHEQMVSLTKEQRGVVAREYTKQNLNTSGLKTPLDLKLVKKFERKNKHLKRGINVYTMYKQKVIPVYKSKFSKENKDFINILLVERTDGLFHYVYINNFNAFCQTSNNRSVHCFRCLNSFTTVEALNNHEDLCSNEKSMRTEVPSPGSQVKFKAFDKQVLQGIIGACDFEASLIPVTRDENAIRYNCGNCRVYGDVKDCTHNTTDIHKQVPTTYSIMLMDRNKKIIFEKTESEEGDVLENFFETVQYIEDKFFPLLQQFKVKKDYTQKEEEDFREARVCYLCKYPFQENVKKFIRVRDHCHFSNEYLGAAHHSCNWKRTNVRYIPVFIHNFRNYDVQFLLQGMKYYTKRNVGGLPYNMEKFRTLHIGRINFVDSIAMLPTSLQELVKNLRDSNHPFPLIDQLPPFQQYSEHKNLLLEKGVYPYEWASSVNKLLETTSFPPHSAFYSVLSQQNISTRDYEHGLNVFSKFEHEDMLDYCHLYCRLDTVLLLEVVTAFRTMVMTEFGLDSTMYISTPQLAFDCMLRTLKKPIDLMTDSEMIMMCEQNVRGGVCFVNERHVKLDDYTKGDTESKIQDHLFYIDANNLYSVAQSSPMPEGDYGWCSENDLKILFKDILSIPVDNEIGFILEVDLEYPTDLHESHSSMPLMPEKDTFQYQDLSPFSQESLRVLQGNKAAIEYKAEKLVTNVKNKTNYVLHYRNLQTYMNAGIKLKKIRRAIKFTQSRYLKPYIESCTSKRQNAKTKFEKMLFKLFMNSVYGKFLQDNRKHFEVKICTKESTFTKYFSSTQYKGHKILSGETTAVYLSKKVVKLDRLYATGFSILEISKNHMYNSWYNFIQPALGAANVSVVLTDTDSLLIHVKNYSRDEVLDILTPCMDFSNYPPNHKRYNEINKAVPGYFKDENVGNYMTEVIGLKAKCYATKVQEANANEISEHVVCKGVGFKARKNLHMEKFRSCLKTLIK